MFRDSQFRGLRDACLLVVVAMLAASRLDVSAAASCNVSAITTACLTTYTTTCKCPSCPLRCTNPAGCLICHPTMSGIATGIQPMMLGKPVCELCAAGYSLASDKSACIPCSPGSYMAASTCTNAACSNCGPGYTTRTSGANSSTQCSGAWRVCTEWWSRGP